MLTTAHEREGACARVYFPFLLSISVFRGVGAGKPSNPYARVGVLVYILTVSVIHYVHCASVYCPPCVCDETLVTFLQLDEFPVLNCLCVEYQHIISSDSVQNVYETFITWTFTA